MPLKRLLLSSLATASLVAGCESTAPTTPPPGGAATASAAGAAPSGAVPAGTRVRGTVLERLDSGGYSYLRLRTAAGEQWAAVTESAVAVGAEVEVAVQMEMNGFHSKTLERTFERLLFATLAVGDTPPNPHAGLPGAPPVGDTPQNPHAGLPAALPAMPAGLPAAPPAGGAPANPHGTVGSAAPSAPISVPRAEGPSGRTVAEVYANRAQLAGQEVSVRGKVVKVNLGVLGKNWLHVQDGTGAAGGNDLTVTTDATAAVGDVVVVTGPLHLDRDFTAGYVYPVIVEDARVAK